MGRGRCSGRIRTSPAGTSGRRGAAFRCCFRFRGGSAQAKYTFGGREYQLEPGDAFGNAIHGFVHKRPWRIVEQRPDEIVGEFQASVDDPSILAHWPSDFRIRVSYEVRGRELLSDIRFENTGDGPLPCGFGTHTYFRLPLAEGRRRKRRSSTRRCRRFGSSTTCWRPGECCRCRREWSSIAAGRSPGGSSTRRTPTSSPKPTGSIHTWLREPTSGRTVTQLFDTSFTQCIVYTPPHREAICLEPYTCLPDSFRLTAEGHETGLQILAAGRGV